MATGGITFNGTSQFLEFTDKVVGAYPLSLVIWVSAPLDGSGAAGCLSQGSTTADAYQCSLFENSTNNKAASDRTNAAGSYSAVRSASPDISNSAFGLFVVVFEVTQQTVYYNSSSGATTTASPAQVFADLNRTLVGVLRRSAGLLAYAKMTACEAHFFNTALTSSDVTTLLTTKPEDVAGWVDGWTLANNTDLTSIGGTRTLTKTGSPTTASLTLPYSRSTGPSLNSPTVVSAGNTIATVRVTTDTAPTGSAILAVQVLPAATADPSSAAILASPTQTITSGASGARDFNLTGLTNGTAVRAHFTQTGGNVVSTASFTPSTVPGAPTIGTAAAGNAQATVNGTAPASNGGSAITGYRSTATPGGSTVTGASLPITHAGLTNGTAYTFTLAAQNANGYGAESAASNSVTPSAGALYGFRFASTAGLEFGNIVGALTGLGLRPAAEQWVATAHAVGNHSTIIAQSPTLAMGSGGRLPNWSNASIANATNYFVSFRRVSDNWTCSAVLTAELVP